MGTEKRKTVVLSRRDLRLMRLDRYEVARVERVEVPDEPAKADPRLDLLLEILSRLK